MKITINRTLAAISLACASLTAHAAPVTLNTGLIKMGVADNGGLGAGSIGLIGPSGDAIMPGCLCEGWGASGNGSSGYVYGLAGTNIASALTTTTTATGAGLAAQSVVKLNNGLVITQTYSSAAGGKLFGVNVMLTNSTSSTMSDVRYARTIDWDVTPGYYANNYTTVYGGTATGPGGKVLTTSTDPFAVPDPLVSRTQDKNLNVVDSAGDKGGFFVFGFGNLLAGNSVSFDSFIGADSSVSGLLAALGSVGVEAYSYTTGNTPGTDGYAHAPAYGYGFRGLDLAPSLPGGDVPEPLSLALVGVALLAAGAARRRA
ncbi:PEP-CTERM sorting domain-containing protein [Massilia sp. PWRC2]|uniref:PEP-CTERM sorting domain-containing protein n=1 Tax=Massilia sp. PWRC2 TaxID=2804626 RepID=UPI003CF3DAC4